MTDAQSTPSIDDVLSFWFGELDAHGLSGKSFAARWWKKDADFDREIGERFGALIDAVAGGQREDWLGTARGAIAYVIVLDQFTRNVHRGSARMYAADHRALAATEKALDEGFDAELPLAHRAFLYMPLMHCESREAQGRCVALFEAVDQECEEEPRERMKGNLRAAYAHQKIVDRFGRFPHRNAILERDCTPEEEAFLSEPGSSF